jgi:hypothetical protein
VSRPSGRRSSAAASDTIEACTATRLAGLPAGGSGGRTTRPARRPAFRGWRRTPHADLARIAGVEARRDRRTWLTSGRICDVRSVTGADILCRRSDPNEVLACGWQLATAKTIATVGRDGEADVEACAGLRCTQLFTAGAGARNARVRRIAAARVAARWKLWRYREWIALVAPKTLVVARAGVLVEVAVLPTRGVVLSGDAAVVRVFRVVARPGTIGIGRVLCAIAVIVDAVATLINLALAGPWLTNVSRRTAILGAARIHSRPAHSCAGSSVISPDLDGLGAAAGGETCEQAKDGGPCSTLRHGGHQPLTWGRLRRPCVDERSPGTLWKSRPRAAPPRSCDAYAARLRSQ